MTTLNLQVGAGNDDADENDSGANFSDTGNTLMVVRYYTSSTRKNAGCVFDNVTIGQGATINSAYWSADQTGVGDNDVYCTIYANDVDDANNFDDEADVTSRTRTTASVDWEENNVGDWDNSPDISTTIKEIVDREGWSSGNSLCILLIGKSGSSKEYKFKAYDLSTTNAPKLDIDYTEAASGTNCQLNISDSWKTVDAMQINIGDAWKEVAGIQINIGDAWKTVM